MDQVNILTAVGGGALLGLGATVFLLFNGKILGISGIVGGLLQPRRGDVFWRVVFVLGLVAGGLLMALGGASSLEPTITRSIPVIGLAGLLVGFGTRMGNGCTSGHGICGIARLSPRSLVATVTFIGTGAIATFAARHVLGGAL